MDTIVGISMADGAEQVLATGNDFYSSPRLSRGWQHTWPGWPGTTQTCPGMAPGCTGRVGETGAGARGRPSAAGGPEESIFQPEWSPDGVLHFVSRPQRLVEPLPADRRVAGRAALPDGSRVRRCRSGSSAWPTYAFDSAAGIVCTYTTAGHLAIGRLDTGTGATDARSRRPIPTSGSCSVADGRVVFIGGSPRRARRSCVCDLATRCRGGAAPLSDAAVDPGYLSVPRADRIPDRGRPDRPRLLLPAANRDFVPPDRGAAAAARQEPRRPDRRRPRALDLAIQYWTSRGFARARRELRRQHRLRARLPRSGSTANGASSTSTTASTAPATWSSSGVADGGGWRSPAAAPAATPPCARSPSATSSRPAPATTASATWKRWPATPTSSSRATSIA